MRTTRRFVLGASLLASLAIVGTTGGGAIVAQSEATVIVGSDDFYESEIVAEIWAQALEAEGYNVDRSGLGMQGRPARAAAFESGQVNLVPEYVGFGLQHYTRAKDASPDVAAIETSGNAATDAQSLQTVYDLLGIPATLLGLSSGVDTNAAVVRPDTAEQYGLTKMSDLAAVQDELSFGLPSTCEANAPCQGALEESYGINWPPAQRETLAACGAVMADALAGNVIDVAWMCSTQPVIAQNGWIVLEDDLETQPPGNLVPVVRTDLLEQVDGGAATFAAILDPISAELTTQVLTELGVRFNIEKADIPEIAADFLATLES